MNTNIRDGITLSKDRCETWREAVAQQGEAHCKRATCLLDFDEHVERGFDDVTAAFMALHDNDCLRMHITITQDTEAA